MCVELISSPASAVIGVSLIILKYLFASLTVQISACSRTAEASNYSIWGSMISRNAKKIILLHKVQKEVQWELRNMEWKLEKACMAILPLCLTLYITSDANPCWRHQLTTMCPKQCRCPLPCHKQHHDTKNDTNTERFPTQNHNGSTTSKRGTTITYHQVYDNFANYINPCV